jgi:hypothetical protein
VKLLGLLPGWTILLLLLPPSREPVKASDAINSEGPSRSRLLRRLATTSSKLPSVFSSLARKCIPRRLNSSGVAESA